MTFLLFLTIRCLSASSSFPFKPSFRVIPGIARISIPRRFSRLLGRRKDASLLFSELLASSFSWPWRTWGRRALLRKLFCVFSNGAFEFRQSEVTLVVSPICDEIQPVGVTYSSESDWVFSSFSPCPLVVPFPGSIQLFRLGHLSGIEDDDFVVYARLVRLADFTKRRFRNFVFIFGNRNTENLPTIDA